MQFKGHRKNDQLEHVTDVVSRGPGRVVIVLTNRYGVRQLVLSPSEAHKLAESLKLAVTEITESEE